MLRYSIFSEMSDIINHLTNSNIVKHKHLLSNVISSHSEGNP